MTLIEKTFGKEVTTRTWDTIAKVARAIVAERFHHALPTPNT